MRLRSSGGCSTMETAGAWPSPPAGAGHRQLSSALFKASAWFWASLRKKRTKTALLPCEASSLRKACISENREERASEKVPPHLGRMKAKFFFTVLIVPSEEFLDYGGNGAAVRKAGERLVGCAHNFSHLLYGSSPHLAYDFLDFGLDLFK